MQKTYWASMVQWKYELLCMETVFRKNVTISRAIKVATALISSAALATWVIWNEHPLIWGAIIVVGQMLTVVYEYTPYQSRISSLSRLITELQKLCLSIEADWYHVANGDLTEDEIAELRTDYAKQWDNAQSNVFSSDWTGISTRRSAMISKKTDQYFGNLYGEA